MAESWSGYRPTTVYTDFQVGCNYNIDIISNFVKIPFEKNGVLAKPRFSNHLIERPPFQRRFHRVVHCRDKALNNRNRWPRQAIPL